MFKNSIFLIFLVIFISGCSTFKPTIANLKSDNKKFIGIKTKSNLSNYGFTHTVVNNSLKALIQTAAVETLLRDKKYFAFYKPDEISNFSGSMISSAKELYERCSISIANVFVNNNSCNLHIDRFTTKAIIAVFDEPQSNVVTYKARSVIEYMKKEDMFDIELLNQNQIEKLNI